MSITFNDKYELLASLTSGGITFPSEDETRWLVNAICNSCIEGSREQETNIFSFFKGSGCGSWDLDEWCQEVLQCNGWGIDWYDVITMKIDADSLLESVRVDYDFPYSNVEMKGFIEIILVKWRVATLQYFKKQLT